MPRYGVPTSAFTYLTYLRCGCAPQRPSHLFSWCFATSKGLSRSKCQTDNALCRLCCRPSTSLRKAPPARSSRTVAPRRTRSNSSGDYHSPSLSLSEHRRCRSLSMGHPQGQGGNATCFSRRPSGCRALGRRIARVDEGASWRSAEVLWCMLS